MHPADFVLRANFYTWFLHRCVEEPQFPRQILFNDECRVTRDAVLNKQISHVWDDETPYAQHAHWFQQRFGINVWAGIVDGRSIGSYLFPTPKRVTHIFLREVFGELLENISSDIRRRLWFQHDGAPPHFAGAIRDYLNQCFGQKWVGEAARLYGLHDRRI